MRTVHYKIANEYAKLRVNRNKAYRITNNEWKEIAKNVYKDDIKPLSWVQCRKSMNMPEVQKVASLRIMQLLDEKGLTANKTIDLLNESIEMAKDQKNSKLLFEQSKYLAQQQGIEREKTVVTETRSYNSDLTGISDVISKEKETKRKLTVSTTINNGSENEEK